MAHRITITFPSDGNSEFYGRVFWFAEALHGPIIHQGRGTMNDIDTARETLWIELTDKHQLGEVKTIVRKMLARFTLTVDAIVTFE